MNTPGKSEPDRDCGGERRSAVTAGALACLFALLVSGCAAIGVNINKEQQVLVRAGMTADDVLRAIGRPMYDRRYRNQPGPTWTYHVNTPIETLFDVDFIDGKVAATSERIIGVNGGINSGNK